MKKSKEDKIVKAVWILAGISVTACITYTVISDIKMLKDFSEKSAEMDKRLEDLAKGIIEARKELNLISGAL